MSLSFPSSSLHLSSSSFSPYSSYWNAVTRSRWIYTTMAKYKVGAERTVDYWSKPHSKYTLSKLRKPRENSQPLLSLGCTTSLKPQFINVRTLQWEKRFLYRLPKQRDRDIYRRSRHFGLSKRIVFRINGWKESTVQRRWRRLSLYIRP